MKIQIDLGDNLPFKGQLKAVEQYILKNITTKQRQTSFLSVPYIETDIKTTPKGTGEKIKTDLGSFHVACHKTKGGTLKFKTWNG